MRPLNGALCHIQWPGILFPAAQSYLFTQNWLEKERKREREKEGRKERRARIGEVAAVERSPVAECYSSQLN